MRKLKTIFIKTRERLRKFLCFVIKKEGDILNNIIDLLNQLIKDTEKGVKGYLKAQLILMFLTL